MNNHFGWIDYVVLSCVLSLSIIIGIYNAYHDRPRSGNKTEQFLLAGKKMSIFPVAVSALVSSISAISILGFAIICGSVVFTTSESNPVEVYNHGAVGVYTGLGQSIAYVIVAFVFAPFLYNLKVTSVYQYLQDRFSPAVHYITCAVLLTCVVLFMGVSIYAPSVALSQVIGIPDWVSILLIGTIATVYTTIGGMKGVVWVDTFQAGIMLLGMILLVVMGTIQTGGVSSVWEKANQQGRINLQKITPNPLVRSTVWSYTANGFFMTLVSFISNQFIVQRLFTVPSAYHAKMAVLLILPLHFCMTVLYASIGLIMFAYYSGCDPMQNGRISGYNQYVPLFMMDVLGSMPGVSGLFLAGMFSAALSTLSSALNAISASLLVDIINPFYRHRKGHFLGDIPSLVIAKTITVVSGVVVLGFAFIALYADVDLFTITLAIGGILSSPIGALFFLGRLFPSVNSLGACLGILVSLTLSCVWGAGALQYPSSSQALPVTSSNCYAINSTELNITSTYSYDIVVSGQHMNGTNITEAESLKFRFSDLYKTSPLWFFTVGFCVTVITALIVTMMQKIIKRLKFACNERYQYQQANTECYDVVS